MVVLGVFLIFFSVIALIVSLADFDANIAIIMISIVVIILSSWGIAYDVKSPFIESISKTYITTELGDKTFSQPVKVIEYKTKPTRPLTMARLENPSRYEIEILSEEAFKKLGNNLNED